MFYKLVRYLIPHSGIQIRNFQLMLMKELKKKEMYTHIYCQFKEVRGKIPHSSRKTIVDEIVSVEIYLPLLIDETFKFHLYHKLSDINNNQKNQLFKNFILSIYLILTGTRIFPRLKIN